MNYCSLYEDEISYLFMELNLQDKHCNSVFKGTSISKLLLLSCGLS